jgi:hypothetical protein
MLNNFQQAPILRKRDRAAASSVFVLAFVSVAVQVISIDIYF